MSFAMVGFVLTILSNTVTFVFHIAVIAACIKYLRSK